MPALEGEVARDFECRGAVSTKFVWIKVWEYKVQVIQKWAHIGETPEKVSVCAKLDFGSVPFVTVV